MLCALLAVAALCSGCAPLRSGAARTSGAGATTVRADDIVFERDGQVWSAHADGTQPRQVGCENGMHVVWGPAWSPDRKRIAYATGRWRSTSEESTLTIVSASGEFVGAWRRHSIETNLAYSPDGGRIAFVEWDGRREQECVVVFNVVSRESTVVCELPKAQQYPRSVSWSPDGARLLLAGWVPYSTHRTPGVLALDTGEFTWLSTPSVAEANWAPNGKTIVAGTESGSQTAIVLLEPDGTIIRVLARGGVDQYGNPDVSSPVFTPDGSAVLYSGRGGVHSVRVDGTGSRRVVPNGSTGGNPGDNSRGWVP